METTNIKENFPDYKNSQENYNLLKQSEGNRKNQILRSTAAAGCEHLTQFFMNQFYWSDIITSLNQIIVGFCQKIAISYLRPHWHTA